MENRSRQKKNRMAQLIQRIDSLPLLWPGMLLAAATFLPCLYLGEGSVFTIHDQLDETLLTYVLNARHLGEGLTSFPELLGGVNVSGMQPAAVLFIVLYRVLPTFAAFLLQYLIVCLCGFAGMYLSVKETTGSSILSFVLGMMFCLLPIQPVYGLSVLGVPLLLYAFLCLWKKKRIVLSMLLVLFFGLTTHLVLIGYVVLSFWALSLLVMLIRKNKNIWVWAGFLLLLVTYIAVNHSLFLELLLGNSSYVSHRAEQVNTYAPVWESIRGMFINGGQHASSLHTYLILPIVLLLLWDGVQFCRMSQRGRQLVIAAAAGFFVLILIAVLYGVCLSGFVAELKNSMEGFLRYFQLERYYWLYPAGWYLVFAFAFGAWWQECREGAQEKLWRQPLLWLAVLGIFLLPTVDLVKVNSDFYRNVNQINNGSDITGYISWESYYAEELMEELEDAIGRDMSEYRVAHLGMSPAPALMHGFYTADGYSNNYPLEYKHRFRRVIAGELEKNEATRKYFDEWGSRCYLFNAATGNYYMLSRKDQVKFEGLSFDMEALKELGCEYLFSGGEILDAERMGLVPMGYYETQDSYWGVWLYAL